jgi:hypothetical protein
MLTASNLLKSAAVAGLLAFGATGAAVTPASADTFETHCNSFGDCYRMRCNDWHEDCVRVGYYRSDYDNDRRRWVCDSDGDDCHWQYDSDRYYDRPNVDFGFHF